MSLDLNIINTATNKLERCLDKYEVILNCRRNKTRNHTSLDYEVGSKKPIISVDLKNIAKEFVVTRIKDGSSRTAYSVDGILLAVDELLKT